MRLLRRLISGVAALVHRRRVEQELNEELRAYLDEAVERKVETGLPREAALRAARVEMGSLEAVKDHTRDVGWESRIESLGQDARYACRGLRRSPGFTAVAVLTLALGIGANTAIFSVVNGLLLRALPVAAPEQLVVLSTRSSIEQGFPAGWTYPMWDEIRTRTNAFDGAVAWSVFPERFDLAQGGESQPADGLFVSGNFFEELGVRSLIGRTFTANEDGLGSPRSRVAVISYGFWQRHFGGAPDVVGRTLPVNRVPVAIVGVTPPEFLGPEVGRAFEIAPPIGSAPVVLSDNRWGQPEGFSYLAVMLRLKPGQSIESATGLLRGMHRQIIEASMGPRELWGPHQDVWLKDPFVLAPAATGTSELRRQYSQSIVTVLTIAALVLFIACANIANLLQARATTRQREISTRLAVGAPRWRIVQQVLVESLVLSVIGAAVGLLLAVWGSRALVAQLSTWFDRVVLDVSLDWRVIAYTSTAAVVTAVVFGTATAVRSSRIAPGAAAQGGAVGQGFAGTGGVHVRGTLVAAQVALSLVLLVAAGLFIRTFERLAAVPLGFDSDRILVVRMNASRAVIASGNRPDSYQRLADAVAAMPGVTHAAASLNTPVNRGVTMVADFSVPGGPAVSPRDQRVIVQYVTPSWFETYGVAVREGRVINGGDTGRTTPVVVANEAFVRRFFPGGRAVGSFVTDALAIPDQKDMPKTVIGVVGDAVDQSLRAEPFPALYLPLAQLMQHPAAGAGFMSVPEVSLSVRAATGSPAQLARSVAATLTSFDRNLTFSFQSLAEQVDAARHQERLVAWLSGFFGALALLMAAIGLYGVTSYAVAHRRTEIGIRIALGAQRRDVIGLALRHTILMTAAGVVVGLAIAAAVTRYMEAMLFGITALDPVTFIAAPALLTLVAGVAALVPARRAAAVDPMIALRSD